MNLVLYQDSRGCVYRYGEFFPPDFSPLAYNDTTTQDYFPLTKEKAIMAGFRWRDPTSREYEITVAARELQDHIRDVSESILKEVIRCASCLHAYRILRAELAFYRRFDIPLPRLCHDCRYQKRLKSRNPPRWYERNCLCGEQNIYTNKSRHFHGHEHCPNKFQTSYAPDRPEIVYCEVCYQSEVI